MPDHFTLSTIPIPLNSKVKLKQLPARTVAVIKYSGRWTQVHFCMSRLKCGQKLFLFNYVYIWKELYETMEGQLIKWIEQQNLKAIEAPVWARFVTRVKYPTQPQFIFIYIYIVYNIYYYTILYYTILYYTILYIYIYVCMYVYVHTHICIHRHIHIHIL